MYNAIKEIHSIWAYLVLVILVLAFIKALFGFFSKKNFLNRDYKLFLFALIFSHVQLLMGMLMYFLSPYFTSAKAIGFGPAMRKTDLRLYVVEHPLIMIIGIVLITIGWSKQKKETTDLAKFKTISVFYGIALFLFLSKIPWHAWI